MDTTIVSPTTVLGWNDRTGRKSKRTTALFLKQIIQNVLVSSGIFSGEDDCKPDHTLINFYDPGQGILHHTDGPKYLPRVAILSLSSSCIMTFKPYLKPHEVGIKDGRDLFSVLLRPRSILIFEKEVYVDMMHGIYPIKCDVVGQVPSMEEMDGNEKQRVPCVNCDLANAQVGDIIDRGKRVSLTFRKAIWDT